MKYFFTFLFLSLLNLTFAQKTTHELFQAKGEVYFSFTLNELKMIDELTTVISIDNVKKNTVYAYANEKEFNKFLSYNLSYTILPHPGDAIVETSSSPRNIAAWDVYPTYDAYLQMMNNFQMNYAGLCKIVEVGTTPGGRKLLFAKLSKDVNVKGPKPQFMFASSMHGDEATGYVLMLRLIDSLLTSYGSNPRITRLLDSVEIWIQPLSNPDGTYKAGNSTVTGAVRYNFNNIDLNRNCPDPDAGPHPDGNAWQPETVALMNLVTANNFILSANFHGGAEVLNYPWDTWARITPDNTWYRFVARQFADTVHAHSPSTYMDDYENGITNGYAWYRITGGRQDYITYFNRGREITMEISNTKLLSGSLLPTHWEYLKRSFFNYIENVYYGIRGKVTNQYGNPLKAKIVVQGLDFDNGDIKSDSITGMYYRMIAPGTYTITVSADSCTPKTIAGISITNFNAAYVDVQLITTSTPVELLSFNAVAQNNKVKLNWSTSTEKNNKGFEIQRRYFRDSKFDLVTFISGNGTTTERKDYSFSENLTLAGKYYYKLYQVDLDGSRTLVGEAETNASPSEFSLSQNYPNPFNPSTSINFSIPVSGNVTIKLYDLLGTEVKTLINENKEEGLYTYLLNASELPSGMYIYKIQVGNYSDSKKLMLLK